MKDHSEIFAHTDCVSQETLSKYISGDLSPAEKHEVEKHLVDCEMCSDAVEGLSMTDAGRFSAITAELNGKVQPRAEGKSETKVVFLRQYRTQLAVAASLVLVLGLVWFFRLAISMKEMDSVETEQIFADKFEPPPAEKSEEQPDAIISSGNEQTETDGKLIPAVQEPQAVIAENRKVSAKDITDGNFEIATAEESPMQDIQDITLAEKEAGDYRWNKNAETPKENAKKKAELKTRNEKNTKGEISQFTVTKEAPKKETEGKNRKADESKKARPVEDGQLPKSEVSTASGTTSSPAPSSPDKSGMLAKKQQLKQAETRKQNDDDKNVKRDQGGEEGDILALESERKWKESSGKKKSKAPEQTTGRYYDFKTTTTISNTSTAPQTQSEITVTDSMAFMFGAAVTPSDLAADSAMIKYDKKDYAGAVADFEKTLKQNPNDEKALFYSAVSYLGLGQADKALAHFNKILANKNSKYYDDAQWYSSLAYIKNNDLKNARNNLQLIQNNEKSRYRQQADETLKQIK